MVIGRKGEIYLNQTLAFSIFFYSSFNVDLITLKITVTHYLNNETIINLFSNLIAADEATTSLMTFCFH